MGIRHIFTTASLALAFARTNAENSASGKYGYTTAYDYIIVGAGASGIIAAQRFVERGSSVLLLERGGPSLFSSGGTSTLPWNNTVTPFDIPSLGASLSDFPGLNAFCDDTPDLSGCILGGSTAINSMNYINPSRDDFDAVWPEGWRWDDIQASAAKVYKRNPGTITPSSDGRYYDSAVYDVLSKELAQAGYNSVNTVTNPNDKKKIYGHSAVNVINGLRAGPVRTYLPLAQGKPNFKLELHTKVIRAVRKNSTVTGVEVIDKSNQRRIINIKKGGKVIFAAGAMSTPRLLFNSGIGPIAQIKVAKAANVTLPDESAWIISPVGAQVQDHAALVVTFNITGGNMTVVPISEINNPGQENIDLFAKGSGVLAETPFRLNTFQTVTTSDGHKIMIQTHCFSRTNNQIDVVYQVTLGTTSVGSMAMDAAGKAIYTKSPLLQTAADKEALAIELDNWLALTRTPGSRLAYAGGSNTNGAEIIKANTIGSGYHLTSSTIMGTDDGTKGGKSVVDTNCKVYGTDNLFVIDLGIHPKVPSGNTMVITMVAAEHAVTKILKLESKGW
ncbi:GMC oxidoreductase [Bipolaris oryzae ATCC 44560]|uniref:GMC oxidoreductase n=1 Tax=Bipolaris oryzae ATCC 44560 TaxID=930090 RepID=W6ZGC4_COCMI|nr:GMC oxidoreductase [Bipolaris oryzae ATCC 44560]EUC49080.1 GMC oxidoreductase [Bipolaris oryzae ATCC 44560]